MKIVIRAGGSGTRLWPLSRQREPKQFLPLLGHASLLEEKIRELRPLIRRWSDVYISASEIFVSRVKKLAPLVPTRNIIAEPVGRNTGPAIALESAVIEAALRGREDPIVASLTVDDVFRRAGAFRSALRAAERFLRSHPLWSVALAAKPPVPDPGLSYITLGRTLARSGPYAVTRCARWVEKPSQRQLARLVLQPRVFAHTGLYIWKASTLLSNIERFQPSIADVIRSIQRSYGRRTFASTLRRLYPTLPSMSIEEAVARHLERLAILADDFGWSDTGKWHLVKLLLGSEKQNVTRGRVVSVDDEDCLLYAAPGKVLGTIGLRGMIVVDTPDALLICPQDRSSDMKALLERLKERGFTFVL